MPRIAQTVGAQLLAPIVFIAIVASWELLVVALDVPPFILPRPTEILVTFRELAYPRLAEHAVVTLLEIGLGYGFGIILGFSLAVTMSVFPTIRAALYPLVLATQTTPKIAVAPLLMLWFGVGLTPKVLVVALLAFFPVLINTLVGLESVDRSQLALMRSVNATKWQVYRYIRIPTAVPYTFAALRLGLTVSIIGAIVAEWVGANAGLGWLLVFYNATMRTAELFAVLLTLVILAVSGFILLAVAERTLSWEKRIGRSKEAQVASAEAVT